jgi:hypothetical protein
MTTLHLTLPDSLQRHLQEMADIKGVPVDQLVMRAVVENMSALSAETDLRVRASRADPAAFRAMLDQVPHRAPLAGDE